MKEISFYLQKFRTISFAESEVKKMVASVVKDVLGLEIPEKDISINRDQGEVCVKATPAAKNELFMHRESILESLKRRSSSIKNIK